MSSEPERNSRPQPIATPPQRRSPLLIAVIAVAVLALVVVITANVWTEVVWYQQLGFTDVWRTQWITRVALFTVFGIVAAFSVWISLWIARRVRPAPTAQRSTLDQYREQIQPLERIIMVALPLFVGLIAGAAMSANWKGILAWMNQESFGIVDPEFGLDASFYVFTLPVLQSFVGYYLAITIICTLLAAFVHLLYGGIGGGGRKFVASGGARIHLAIMGLLVMIGIAANYWLDRYALLNKQGEALYGASYTDINAILPALGILVGIAVLVGVSFLIVIWQGDWRIPAMGVALMVLSAIVVGWGYPAVVQRFQVEPNAQELESPYIQRNIDATRYAYGLDDIEVTQYNAKTEAEGEALRADAETTTQIRLLDPNVVSPAFQQLEQNKQYYNFAADLNVDRYDINGELRDTVIAVRELNLDGLGDENRTWVNDTTVYTHGFGVVAAYGNRTQLDGQPDFYEGGIPSVGELGDYEPRIYFGESTPAYSIVGAPEGTAPWELDYPTDSSDTVQGNQVNTTYTGDGGPSIGNTFAKFMYAIKFGEEQIFFSDRVTSESQILYYREPLERVARVAPYLELDSSAYPAVVDGRVVWIVDGYTTSSQYPYSGSLESASLFAGSEDRLTPVKLNYMRNSVKATVDAYNGEVTLYAWDTEDPIIKTWSNVFPNDLKPMSEISSDLMSHLRYPQDQFTVQRFQLSSYHVEDAADFYSGQDFWRNPSDPTPGGTGPQPPYYLTLQMPGQEDPTFSLTSSFIPGGNSDRNVLTGYLSVDSETGNEAGKVASDYGQLRLLELPRDTTIPGPGQVQNNFNSNSDAQTTLNLLRQGETEIINGNLLTLPVGGGLLYVQPVYVQSSTGTQVPLLRKVFVSFGDSVGFADTLQGALDQVFGEGAAVTTDLETGEPSTSDPDATDPDTTDPLTPEPEATDPDATPGVGTASEEDQQALRSALAKAQQAIADGQAALSIGDFGAYGDAQQELSSALEDAIAAERRIQDTAGGAAEETPSPTVSPSADAS
ncbi:UPF0182 family protein [Demequina aurantiaca]|uniref:UPF0182 family membrane protein n=1 Tax=Demequina aurantiaca TaxID=676200 RepID=UPI003D32FA40